HRLHMKELGDILQRHQRQALSLMRDMDHPHLGHPRLVPHVNHRPRHYPAGAGDELLNSVGIREMQRVEELRVLQGFNPDAPELLRQLTGGYDSEGIRIDQQNGHRKALDQTNPECLSPLRFDLRKHRTRAETLEQTTEILSSESTRKQQ